MHPPRICTFGLLAAALMAVSCGRRSPEQWQTFVNEREQQRIASIRLLSHNPNYPLPTVSECRDGRPDWEYVCKRTYDLQGLHTTETIGYGFPRVFLRKDPNDWFYRVLTQKRECSNGSSRPGPRGC